MSTDQFHATAPPHADTRLSHARSAQAVNHDVRSAIFTAALDCIISFDQSGLILDFNEAAESTFGVRSAEVLGKDVADVIIPPQWRTRHKRGLRRYLSDKRSTILNRRIELLAVRANGVTFPIELAVVPLAVKSNPVYTAFIRDISERKRHEALQTGQNRILSKIAQGIPLQDLLDDIARFVEKQVPNCLCTVNLEPVAPPPATLPAVPEARQPAPGAGPGAALPTCPGPLADGAAHWSSRREADFPTGTRIISSWPIVGRHREILGRFLLNFPENNTPDLRDLKLFNVCTGLAGLAIESRTSEERIRHLAHYDGLTSLPNRFLFQEYLEHALLNARRHKRKFAVMFIDFDRFKQINDNFGHAAGDQVLRTIALRLKQCLRSTDTIARMGGDEFYGLVNDLADLRYVRSIAQKLLDAASQPVMLDRLDCHLSVSIGIALYPDDGMDAKALLENADHAMYRAKTLGKNRFEFYHAASGGKT